MDPWPEARDFALVNAIDESRFSIDSPIRELRDNLETLAVVNKHLPDMAQQMGHSEQARNMTLRGAAHFTKIITPQLLDATSKDLASIEWPEQDSRYHPCHTQDISCLESFPAGGFARLSSLCPDGSTFRLSAGFPGYSC
jgi:hypothetical protein